MDFKMANYENVDSENENSEDDVGFEIDVETEYRKKQTAVEDHTYEVLSTEEIVQHMDDCIRKVNSVVGIPANTTRILLNHFKWDQEKLIERFYDEDQDKLFSEAHAINPLKELNMNAIAVQPEKTDNGTEECQICFIVRPCLQMTGLNCGHRFCTQCLSVYLTAKIMEEGVGQTIACAAHRCDIFVDDASVMRLVSDSKVLLKYQHLITNSFVECNRLLRWCPSLNCSNAIKVLYVDTRPVTCKCGHVFCFSCGEDWHDPIKCNLLKKWIEKYNYDSETGNWSSANSKECPKCKTSIEKTGGSSHMTCRNASCQHEFCWSCLDTWDIHPANYDCSPYDEIEASREAQERSRAALHKYWFFHNRYKNNQGSLMAEHKLYAYVETKMQDMRQQYNMSRIEVQFLKKAVEILCKCRQVLMYTYVFAYYLKKNNQSLMLEVNQGNLESATETLLEYLKRDITSAELTDIKQKVQDKYRYCEKRSLEILKHIHEGYEKNWWEYNVEFN